MSLFEENRRKTAPLADRMRPKTLDEFVGQEHIIGKRKLLRRAIELDRLTSSIFFGPPGCGKTTLAQMIAAHTGSEFQKINAVSAGVKEVRQIIEQAEKDLDLFGKSTYLLLDECHRWSKAQSDSILPALEQGIIRFIGSTTENPMIAMTPAIVSRCRIFEFHPLSKQDILRSLQRALTDRENGLGELNVDIVPEALEHIAITANGDVRNALNALELAVLTTPPSEGGKIVIDLEIAKESIQNSVVRCDDNAYYDMISAFCKSLRGSDSDAALFWFAKMIYGGVDPRAIVRRMIVHASEDIGLANPSAMAQAVAAYQALESVGMPEARLSIGQAIIFLCECPKSNSTLMAVEGALQAAQNTPNTLVPAHLRDTHYRGAEQLGNGKGYQYPHDFENHYVPQQYLPDSLKDARFYMPSDEGYERNIKERRKRLHIKEK